MTPNDFRIVGQWLLSRCVFLVVMGIDAKDCQSRLFEAFDDYTSQDLAGIESIWFEYFNYDSCSWVPLAEIHMGQLRRAKVRTERLLNN